jgi:hypothetical protein
MKNGCICLNYNLSKSNPDKHKHCCASLILDMWVAELKIINFLYFKIEMITLLTKNKVIFSMINTIFV